VSPLTEGIVAGVIANGITSILSYIIPQGDTRGHQGRAITHLLEKDQPLATILQKATASVARSSSLTDTKQTEKLRLFMISPDAESLVRQIYGIYFAPEERLKSEPQIREAFLCSLALHLGVSLEAVKPLSNILFPALLEGCERALSLAIDQGVLSAHEAKSASRHLAILDELSAIQENLRLLREPTKLDLREILDFETKFRKQLADRHGFITPPHFDAARKLPIKDICVAPKLMQLGQAKDTEPISLDQFVSRLHRAVVLGNPGGGKSTMAGKLCYDLASDIRARRLANREITPMLVVLRDYGAAKKDSPCSFVQFIERVANSNYQIQPPPRAIEYLLLNGRTAVIFDGLDELLDTASRREIASDIESFCTLYPSVPVLVTSREVGYEQAPLDQGRFVAFRLSPFDEDQVREYARKWFACDSDLTFDQRKQKAAAFLSESEVVSDLRSNPLMLGLMCNIYRGENYIPKNRPDVYEKCSTMLFERWDKGRGIFVPLPFEHHISPAMKYLAHWIYSDEKLQAGVTEPNLVAKATDYLCDVRFEDRDEGESAARKFIDFCKGRAWVFTDTGTTKEGDSLYQFTHRTFLEYFTAAHIVRTNARPADLLATLITKIEMREWDVVAQLSFQLQNKQLEGAGNDLLTSLVDHARRTHGQQTWNVLSFAARCLEFIVPSPRVTREIVTACVEHTLSSVLTPSTIASQQRHSEFEPSQLIGDCLIATVENWGPIADCFSKLMIDRIKNGNEAESVAAAHLALNPSWSISHGRRFRPMSQGVYQFWSDVSNQIAEACSSRILQLCPQNFGTSFDWFVRGKITVSELVGWHGAGALFKSCHHSMHPNVYLSPLGAILIYQVIFNTSPEVGGQLDSLWVRAASDVGRHLIDLPTPWMKAHPIMTLPEWPLPKRASQGTGVSRLVKDPTGLFGCFALLALMVENTMSVGRLKNLAATLKAVKQPDFEDLSPLLAARLEKHNPEEVQRRLDSLQFNRAQQAFVSSWIRAQIDLVSPPQGEEATAGLVPD
jgi:NACHT domain-containing protein